MLNRIVNGGSNKINAKILELFGFTNVPSGEWELKKGELSQSSLNGSKYIPLTIYAYMYDTSYGFTYKTFFLKDNKGTTYFTLTHGWDTSQNGHANCYTDIYLPVKNSYDCDKLLAIRSFSGYKELKITSWLEKVGGVIRNLITHTANVFRKKVLA